MYEDMHNYYDVTDVQGKASAQYESCFQVAIKTDIKDIEEINDNQISHTYSTCIETVDGSSTERDEQGYMVPNQPTDRI